ERRPGEAACASKGAGPEASGGQAHREETGRKSDWPGIAGGARAQGRRTRCQPEKEPAALKRVRIVGLVVLATLVSYPLGLGSGRAWLLPLMNTLPAYAAMIVLLRRGERADAVG